MGYFALKDLMPTFALALASPSITLLRKQPKRLATSNCTFYAVFMKAIVPVSASKMDITPSTNKMALFLRFNGFQ